jgi:HEAT repeat protein
MFQIMSGAIDTLENLIAVRSQLAKDSLGYLEDLALRMAELPSYYPKHLHPAQDGRTPFDNIQQAVRVVEDRSAFEKWLAEERERVRGAGQDFESLAYAPKRARPELGVENDDYRIRERPEPPAIITWDERAGTRFKRAVILGDPGFGKTWLLRYEARRLANDALKVLHQQTHDANEIVFPIFARLSDLSWGRKPLAETLISIASAGYSPAFAKFVRAKLETDRCVILLDGWDEVPTEMPRKNDRAAGNRPGFQQYLAKKLADFAEQLPEPRLLLSSRIVGYSGPPIPKARELELLAFETSQVEGFARVWFDGDSLRTLKPSDSSAAIGPFLGMLRENHQVRGLARIPLMLALICRVWSATTSSRSKADRQNPEPQTRFPTRRVELYDGCLRGLLLEWKEQRDKWCPTDVKLTALLDRLARGAFELLEQQKEQFTESELAEAMGFDLQRKTHREEGDKAIADLKHDGVLISAGKDSRGPRLFLHRTFHEYLAACHLASELEPTKSKRRDQDITARAKWAFVDRKAWDPRWEQVIVLLAGQLQNPIPLLKFLADADRDDLFRHRLCVAALCLPEIGSQAKTPLADVSQLQQKIAVTVWNLWVEQHASSVIFNHMLRSSRAATWFNAQGLSLVAGGAAEELGRLGRGAATPEVPVRLTDLLRDPDWYVRWRAAAALGRMRSAAATPEVLERLTQCLSDPYGDVRRRAAAALERIGSAAAKPDVLARLTELLRDPDECVSGWAAVALGQMGVATPEVLARLTEWLRDPVPFSALQPYFAHDGNIEWLHDSGRSVSEQAAVALGHLGVATPEVLARLIDCLGGPDPDPRLRWSVAEELGRLGSGAATPEVLARLIELLRHPDLDVRWNVAEALEAITSDVRVFKRGDKITIRRIADLAREPRRRRRRG